MCINASETYVTMQIARLSLFPWIILYLYKKTTDATCSSGCTVCNESTCTSCESSYYLSSGNCNQCPDNCKTCDSFSFCTSCESNKWGFTNRCNWDCATECLNQECQDDNGYCSVCKQGNYGLKCQQNCSFCQDGLCDLRACTSGCKPGYYEYEAGGEILCKICPSDCKSCNSSVMCTVCNDGFSLNTFSSYGKMYAYCIQCPHQHICKTCKIRGTSSVCTECKEGYKIDGYKCIPNENNCAQGCSKGCNEDGDNNMNFITGYMSGVGSTVFILALATSIFFIRRRFIAEKSKHPAAEISTYYNENNADIRVSERTANEANHYESLGNRRNTNVYNELERLAVPQGYSYYNIGVTQ